jgi:hypothetical protein
MYFSRNLFRQNSLHRCRKKWCWKQWTGEQIFVVSSLTHNADNKVYNNCDISFTVISTCKPLFSKRLFFLCPGSLREGYGFPDSPMRATCSRFKGWMSLRLLPLKCSTHYALAIMLKLMLRRVTTLMCYGTITPLYDFYIEVNRRMHYETTLSVGMFHLQIHLINFN